MGKYEKAEENIELMELELPRILNTIKRKADIKILNEKDSIDFLRFGVSCLINQVQASGLSGIESKLSSRMLDRFFDNLSETFIKINVGCYNVEDYFKTINLMAKKEMIKMVLVPDFVQITEKLLFGK